MLKERIDYLCRKKGISRKELVEGLVTQAHFANILARRYPLAEDIAEQIAKRLDVAPSYLLQADKVDEETEAEANFIFEQLFQPVTLMNENVIESIQDRHDSLLIELTSAIMKAIYYQQINELDTFNYIHQSYLQFYLNKYEDIHDPALPATLRRALLYYYIQQGRSQSRFYEVVSYAEKLEELIQEGSEAWVSLQHILIEAYVSTRQFEKAKQRFELTLNLLYQNRWFHRLSGLYIAYSGSCFAIGLYEEALLTLSMAEANLVYSPNQGDLMTTILNNRIVMLTLVNKLEQAKVEIERFEQLVQQEPEETQLKLMPVIIIYYCEIACLEKKWGLLAHGIKQLKTYSSLTIDQGMALLFYESQLAFGQNDMDGFMILALECLLYFEQISHKMRLEQLYEELAVACEEKRRYKEVALYYRKLVYLLKNK